MAQRSTISTPSVIPNTNDIASLELLVEEQRIDYQSLASMYESARVKNLAFLGAIFGVLVYLYGNVDPKLDLRDKLFLPDQYYGIAIYICAFGSLIFALAALIMALKGRRWQTAYEDYHLSYISEHTHKEYLMHLSKKYQTMSKSNASSYNAKQSLIELAVLPMLIGAIILLLLKTLN